MIGTNLMLCLIIILCIILILLENPTKPHYVPFRCPKLISWYVSNDIRAVIKKREAIKANKIEFLLSQFNLRKMVALQFI